MKQWYLGSNGTLNNAAPTQSGAEAFTWNAFNRPLTDFTGNTAGGTDGLWTATPAYNWTQKPGGSAVAYVTPPLSSNTTVIGAGGVKLLYQANKPNVDFQATISQCRPDGKQT